MFCSEFLEVYCDCFNFLSAAGQEVMALDVEKRERDVKYLPKRVSKRMN